LSTRSRVETTLHVAAVTLLAWMWWRVVHPSPMVSRAEVIDESRLSAALVRWATGEAPSEVHVRFDAAPGATVRDWLVALRASGTRLTWDASGSLPATAVDVEPVADPRGLVRVTAAAPAGTRLTIGDRFGAFDSVVTPHGIATFRLPPVSSISSSVGRTVARATVMDSLPTKRIYLVGRAGWESKFIARALEQEGWPVDAHFVLAPHNDVAPARSIVLDTAGYAAVVLVDTMLPEDAGRVARFVESGGGLVLGPGATRGAGALAAGSVGAPLAAPPTISDSAPELGLTLEPTFSLRPGTSVLARRRGDPSVTARRVANGRVVQVGYTDTWRWRMVAGDRGVAAHRAWWAGLVAVVAYAPAMPRASNRVRSDPAPLVALEDRLGGPRPSSGAAAPIRPWIPLPWVFAAIVLLLLAEWSSRRLRGAG